MAGSGNGKAPQDQDAPKVERRAFLSKLGGLAGLGLATGGLPLLFSGKAHAEEIVGDTTGNKRRAKVAKTRKKILVGGLRNKKPEHPNNGDESLPNFTGVFSKALPHNLRGEVDPQVYQKLLDCISSGKFEDFESLPMGGQLKLKNPQGAYAIDLEGADYHQLTIPPAPAFKSEAMGGEVAELYWMALARDVPFVDYLRNGLVRDAASDLSRFKDASGPGFEGNVQPSTVFRGLTAGDLTGPYISQFLLQDIPYGNGTLVQVYKTQAANDDHITDLIDWLKIQDGSLEPINRATGRSLGSRKEPVPAATDITSRGAPTGAGTLDPNGRYIRNGRDLATYVHRDFAVQSGLNAALILLGYGNDALNQGNPYYASKTQFGFCTYGDQHIIDLTARVANCALRAAWYQKWCVHRRLRPEEFAGRVHFQKAGLADYGVSELLLNSPALLAVFSLHGTYLLPQAYVEGAPTHPAYPSGHATYAGAMCTVLKAMFNENFIIPGPVQALPDGSGLLPVNEPLTVGGELNKLATNVAFGRCWGGIHYRSDGQSGHLLGEQVAIALLQTLKQTLNEPFSATFTKFNGERITI